MARREIVRLGDPVLRERAREVDRFDEELRGLVRDMFDTMLAAEGAGLAAPQVGISRRVFVAQLRDDSGTEFQVAMVNPVIVERSEDEDRSPEGCLSLPGVTEVVARPARVVVEGFDPAGEPVRLEGDDLLARVVQHEVDHLDGILFFDRISPLKRRMLLKKYHKLEEEEGG